MQGRGILSGIMMLIRLVSVCLMNIIKGQVLASRYSTGTSKVETVAWTDKTRGKLTKNTVSL